jgi:serine/threonine protein kinase
MPPEILSGENSRANPSLDIWAIGLIMCFLLYGKLPFSGSTKEEI